MESLLRDLRYGARMLWQSKGLTLVAVVSLAAGIGANSAVFSIVNSMLLRPRPVAEPDRLVGVYLGDRPIPYQSISYPIYLDLRADNGVFSGLAATGIRQFRLAGTDDVEQIWGEAVSGNYFDVLGIRPFRGRTFLPEEDSVPNRNPVVVLSHGLWRRRFASDPDLVGKAVTINDQSLTVVGIAPPEYMGWSGGLASEIWVPAMVLPALEPGRGLPIITSRGNSWVTLVGRLAAGTTIEQARARLDLLADGMRAAYPDRWKNSRGEDLFLSVVPESESRVHPGVQPILYIVAGLMFAVVDLVLLIACMNLAGMLFARAVTRRAEIAVRLALGAGRFRIIRQLLAESVLLALIAGVAGVALAVWALDLLVAFMPALPEGIRVAMDIRLDWRVVAYSLVFAMLTGILFGLAPAMHCARADVSTVLKDDARAFTARYRTSRVRRALVVAQVAFSLLLLIGAGLVVRSLEKVRPTRLGFRSDDIVVASLILDESRYDRATGQQFYERLSQRVAQLPGVRAVSLGQAVPGGFLTRSRRSTEIEGYTPAPGESREIDTETVGPGYFTNLQVPIVQGRDFGVRDREGAPCVAIINEAFASRYFPGTPSPLGKRLARYAGPRRDRKEMCEIVGVIRDDAWQALNREVRPIYVLPVLQSEEDRMTLLVSSAGDPSTLVQPVRAAIRELDPRMPTDAQTLDEYFSVALYPFRLVGFAMAGCGLLALLLASVGIYGIVAHSVAQRTREVGIRMALGAVPRDILRLVVSQAMALVGYGLVGGLLLALVVIRLAALVPFDVYLLFGVSATDSLTFAGVTGLLALVALVACLVPARKATTVDPMVTLRGA